MSFDYDKTKEKVEKKIDWWASYSDLWSMLSIVFLLMYVTTSLRTGTESIQNNLEYKELQKRNEELEEQNRVYSTLKEEKLRVSSAQEQETYKKLMSKLSLLQEEVGQEAEELKKQAQNNEEKKYALNQYQQIIRNIIDTNVLAEAQIRNRDQVIDRSEKTLQEKQAVISVLNENIQEKEEIISQNKAEISKISSTLEEQIEALREEERRAKLSTSSMQKTIDRLKEESQEKIAKIQGESQKLESEKQQLSQKVLETQGKLQQSNAKLSQTEAELAGAIAKEKDSQEKLSATSSQLEKTSAELAGAKASEKAARRSLALAESDIEELQGAKENLQGENEKLGRDLARAREALDAKKKLIGAIQKNFAKEGVKASIDGKTGDVILDFGNEYFDTGSSQLKRGMVEKLKKFVPVYSKSLFENPKTAEKISNVEIVGFASSTFRGRYVNPSSLKAENQEAINYNLKLSFDRANSIFKYMFDPKRLSYANQKRLLPMVKVVGRGFLPEGASAKELPEDMPVKEFCQKYSCSKAQRVVVRFNMKGE